MKKIVIFISIIFIMFMRSPNASASVFSLVDFDNFSLIKINLQKKSKVQYLINKTNENQINIEFETFLKKQKNLYKVINKNSDQYYLMETRFLIASNPTEIKLTNISFMQWLGDSEPFLSIQLKNISNLPALNVKIKLFSPKTKENELKLTKSNSFKSLKPQSIAIARKSDLVLPIIPVSEIKKEFKSDLSNGYSLIGYSLLLNNSNILCNRYRNYIASKKKLSSILVECYNKPLVLQVGYKTIFDEKIYRLFPINFYFGKKT